MGVLAMFLFLGTLFALGVAYKYSYDLRESAGTDSAPGRSGPRSCRSCRAWRSGSSRSRC